MLVGNSARLQNRRPGLLHVIQDERNELHGRLFGGIALRVNLPLGLARHHTLPTTQQSKKVPLEQEAEYQNEDCSTNAQVNPAKASASTPAAALIATIFEVFAIPARCPTHSSLLNLDSQRNYSGFGRQPSLGGANCRTLSEDLGIGRFAL